MSASQATTCKHNEWCLKKIHIAECMMPHKELKIIFKAMSKKSNLGTSELICVRQDNLNHETLQKRTCISASQATTCKYYPDIQKSINPNIDICTTPPWSNMFNTYQKPVQIHIRVHMLDTSKVIAVSQDKQEKNIHTPIWTARINWHECLSVNNMQTKCIMCQANTKVHWIPGYSKNDRKKSCTPIAWVKN